ncbi:MAG: thioesterase family protein [Rubrivivax sp.]
MTPGPRRNPTQQRQFEAALTELFEQRITFNGVLGLKVLSLQPDAVCLRLDMRRELIGHAHSGRLHGGVISATLDALGGLALMVAMGKKHHDEDAEQVQHRISRMGTIDLRIDFLRQGIGKHFIGSADVTRLGGRIGSVQMRLHNDEQLLIATGAASYVVS